MAGVLTVVAKIHPKPGKEEEEVQTILVKMADAARKAEPECPIYRPHRLEASPPVFFLRAVPLAHRLRGTSMVDENPEAELARLRAENEALKSRARKGINLKVSDKGGVSVYGLGRFPVTLYKEQWLKLLDMVDEIRAFIRENDARLKTKQ